MKRHLLSSLLGLFLFSAMPAMAAEETELIFKQMPSLFSRSKVYTDVADIRQRLEIMEWFRNEMVRKVEAVEQAFAPGPRGVEARDGDGLAVLFDLDETLVKSISRRTSPAAFDGLLRILECPETIQNAKQREAVKKLDYEIHEASRDKFLVIFRPDWELFLVDLAANFEIGFFTAARGSYADAVYKHVTKKLKRAKREVKIHMDSTAGEKDELDQDQIGDIVKGMATLGLASAHAFAKDDKSVVFRVSDKFSTEIFGPNAKRAQRLLETIVAKDLAKLGYHPHRTILFDDKVENGLLNELTVQVAPFDSSQVDLEKFLIELASDGRFYRMSLQLYDDIGALKRFEMSDLPRLVQELFVKNMRAAHALGETEGDPDPTQEEIDLYWPQLLKARQENKDRILAKAQEIKNVHIPFLEGHIADGEMRLKEAQALQAKRLDEQ